MYLLRKEQNWMKKSQKCVFLGYSDVTKAYRLLDVKTNKLVVSRDVIFFQSFEFLLPNIMLYCFFIIFRLNTGKITSLINVTQHFVPLGGGSSLFESGISPP